MIHLIQVLCPDRHAIFAIGYDPETLSPEDAMRGLKVLTQEMIDTHIINPWCGLCGSTCWAYEDRVTSFTTIEEARPVLENEECKQILTRALFGKY